MIDPYEAALFEQARAINAQIRAYRLEKTPPPCAGPDDTLIIGKAWLQEQLQASADALATAAWDQQSLGMVRGAYELLADLATAMGYRVDPYDGVSRTPVTGAMVPLVKEER